MARLEDNEWDGVDGIDDGIVCESGHVINEHATTSPQHTTKFCERCGSKAISACSGCKSTILGGTVGVHGGWPPPSFCHECGKRYPWTDEKIAAACDVLDETDLPPEERENLKKRVPDLIADTPKSDVAAAMFKKAIAKVGGGMRDILTKVVSDIASETIRKTMGL